MSWDKKIILVMVLFMIFILGMGIVMMWKTESAEENYYEKDLMFEQDLQAQKQALSMNINPQIKYFKDTEKLIFDFSSMQKNLKINAEIHFQKPNNKNLTFKTPLAFDENFAQIVFTKELEKGSWNIWITGEANKKNIKTKIQKIEIK